MNEEEKIRNQIKQASKLWRGGFNRKDVEYCSYMYTNDAVMHARPFGSYIGRDQIYEFWRGMIQRGAADLEYKNVHITVLSPNKAQLSATWSMNIGEGFVTSEIWIFKQDQFMWLLKENDFTLSSQIPT